MKKAFFVFVSALFILQTALPLFAEESNEPKLTQSVIEKSINKTAKNETIFNEARKKFNKLSRGGKRIYSVPMRPNVVYRLQTALGFVSTIDLPEPALKVFVGDGELFRVEVYEKEILIKPITYYEDARTNLTVFTESGRLAFDVTVGSPDTADFVLDFRALQSDVFVEGAFKKAVEKESSAVKEEYEKRKDDLDSEAEKLAQEKLKEEVLKSSDSVDLNAHKETGDVRVNLISLSRIGDKSYLRFGIRNLSKFTYTVSRVTVGIESYETKNLGFSKEPQGITELPSSLEIENSVKPDEYVYGVAVFDARALGKSERPVFFVFEENGSRHFKLRGFKWIP